MNDVAALVMILFLCEEFPSIDSDTLKFPEGFDNNLTDDVLEKVEADSYYCLAIILDYVKDFYPHGFPGITKSSALLTDLIKMLDKDFYETLKSNNVEIRTLSFQFFCCLLVRNFPNRCSLQ